MNSVTPVKSTFHSSIDNPTPPSDWNFEAGNPHCCCNASGTDHNIESKLERYFLNLAITIKTFTTQCFKPKKREAVQKSLVRTGPHQIQNTSKLCCKPCWLTQSSSIRFWSRTLQCWAMYSWLSRSFQNSLQRSSAWDWCKVGSDNFEILESQ